MASETDLINNALRLIGGSRITSLSDGTKNANVAGDLYEELRDDLLRGHPWNFAMKRVKLAQSTTAPVFEFDHAYSVPNDWLRTVAVHADDGGRTRIVFREELVDDKRMIITDADDVWMRYVSQVVDPNLMAADFRKALITALARDMAVPIAASNTLQQNYEKRANTALARARSNDGLGETAQRRPHGSWAGVRRRALPIVGDTPA